MQKIQKDLLILSYLRDNARIPLTKLSKESSIPVSTIFDSLKESEKSIIIKHTSLIDFSKLGYDTRANITLAVAKEDKEALRGFLVKHCAVNSVYKINNGFDFMIEGIFKSVKEMDNFMEELEKRFKILEKRAYYIIEDLKRESFMSNPNLVTLGS